MEQAEGEALKGFHSFCRTLNGEGISHRHLQGLQLQRDLSRRLCRGQRRKTTQDGTVALQAQPGQGPSPGIPGP